MTMAPNRIEQRVYRLDRADIEHRLMSVVITTGVQFQHPVSEQWFMNWETDEFGRMHSLTLTQQLDYLKPSVPVRKLMTYACRFCPMVFGGPKSRQDHEIEQHQNARNQPKESTDMDNVTRTPNATPPARPNTPSQNPNVTTPPQPANTPSTPAPEPSTSNPGTRNPNG